MDETTMDEMIEQESTLPTDEELFAQEEEAEA